MGESVICWTRVSLKSLTVAATPSTLLEVEAASVTPAGLPTHAHEVEDAPSHSKHYRPDLAPELDNEKAFASDGVEYTVYSANEHDEAGGAPTEEQAATLRRVAAPIPYVGYAQLDFNMADCPQMGRRCHVCSRVGRASFLLWLLSRTLR